jgi:hypothetical protein
MSCAQENILEPGWIIPRSQPMIVCREAGIRNLESALCICSKDSRAHAWLFRDVEMENPVRRPFKMN